MQLSIIIRQFMKFTGKTIDDRAIEASVAGAML